MRQANPRSSSSLEKCQTAATAGADVVPIGAGPVHLSLRAPGSSGSGTLSSTSLYPPAGRPEHPWPIRPAPIMEERAATERRTRPWRTACVVRRTVRKALGLLSERLWTGPREGSQLSARSQRMNLRIKKDRGKGLHRLWRDILSGQPDLCGLAHYRGRKTGPPTPRARRCRCLDVLPPARLRVRNLSERYCAPKQIRGEKNVYFPWAARAVTGLWKTAQAARPMRGTSPHAT